METAGLLAAQFEVYLDLDEDGEHAIQSPLRTLDANDESNDECDIWLID